MSVDSRLAVQLHAEHVRTLEAMNALEARVMGAGKGSPLNAASDSDADLVKRLLDVIEHDVEAHFRFEEESIFPLLERGGFSDMTVLLTREHAAIRPMAQHLAALARRSLAGPLSADEWRDFRDTTMDLIHGVLFHIQKEEISLIRRLWTLLPGDVDAELAARHADR